MYLPNLRFPLSNIIHAPTVLAKWAPAVDSSSFTLSIAGVLGLFGGDEATFATAMVLVHKHRQWLGWYNTPGSYWIARNYGLTPMSTIVQQLFPNVRTKSTKVLEPAGQQRLRFRAIHSGTILDSTGYLASMLMEECALESIGPFVSVVQLKPPPPEKGDLQRLSTWRSYAAIFPILISVACCIAAFFADMFSFASILVGILCNGVCSVIIGLGTICLIHHAPAAGSPPGDGILDSGNGFVLLRGDESAVNSTTGGKLAFAFRGNLGDSFYIRYSSFVLFTIQFIIQLFLIPQASLLGQITFVCSLVVSWIYSALLFAYEAENTGSRILLDQLRDREQTRKYTLEKRTSVIVFIIYAFFHSERVGAENGTSAPPRPMQNRENGLTNGVGRSTPSPSVTSPDHHHSPLSSSPNDHNSRRVLARNILDTYLPNDTIVWNRWKETVSHQVFTTENYKKPDLGDLQGDERNLLHSLFNYAQEAYDKFYVEVVNRGNLN